MNTLILISVILTNSICPVEVTPSVIQSIINQESGDNPKAVSTEGAIGLMQVSTIALDDYNQRHGTMFTEEHLFSPPINIQVGIDHLCKYANRGYSLDEMILIYWMGHRAFIEMNEGKREYLRYMAYRHLELVYSK